MKLDTQKIAYFREKLEHEKAAIEEELGKIAVHEASTDLWDARPNDADAESDENDRADRAEDYEERTAAVRSLGKQWKDGKDALAKIEAGAYGICEVGGEAIELERLEANPSARTCVAHING